MTTLIVKTADFAAAEVSVEDATKDVSDASVAKVTTTLDGGTLRDNVTVSVTVLVPEGIRTGVETSSAIVASKLIPVTGDPLTDGILVVDSLGVISTIGSLGKTNSPLFGVIVDSGGSTSLTVVPAAVDIVVV